MDIKPGSNPALIYILPPPPPPSHTHIVGFGDCPDSIDHNKSDTRAYIGQVPAQF